MNLRKWLGLCEHKWIEIERGRLIYADNHTYAGIYFTYQCEHCKKLKEVR